MRGLLREFLIKALALGVVLRVLPGVTISGGWQPFATAVAALFVFDRIVKPAIKLFFIPANFLTFGLFSVAVNIGLIYLLTFVIPQLKISGFTSVEYDIGGFIIPAFELTTLLVVVAAAVIISVITITLHWLAD